MASWPVEKYPLLPPPLAELQSHLATSLPSNFHNVTVSVSPCPDLRLPPYNLAAAGLSGNPRVADIGGPPYLHPLPNFTKKYNLLDITRLMEMDLNQGFVLGAGAGPFHDVGVNSELMPNLSYEGQEVRNLTRLARIGDAGECICEPVSKQSRDFALMANLFGSDGRPGEALHIEAQGRKGGLDFISAIQDGIRRAYGDRPVSLGGVFLVERGKVNMHVMPDFSATPLEGESDMLHWLRFFEMSAPLVCLSVFHSRDPGLALRMEHTHCFSEHGEGGHYHGDVTPEEVKYEGWFNVAEVVYRIDRPKDT